MKFLLPDRDDWLGANFVTKMGAFIYATINNYKVYHFRNFPYSTSIYMLPFIINSHELNNDKDIDNTDNDHRRNQAIPVIQLKQDLITYFNDNLKSEFYDIIKEKSKERNYSIPWSDNSNIICIHLRLNDDHQHEGANYADYDGSGSSDYVRELIENECFDKFNKNDMMEYCKSKGVNWGKLSHPDKQCTIDIEKFGLVITQLTTKYPNKKIHVVTKLSNNPNNKKYIDLCQKHDIIIHSNSDYDYDLWLLIHSDILVLSKSTYSLIAGYYHQGSRVIYPLWGTFASCGLSTKYDKTGWESYI